MLDFNPDFAGAKRLLAHLNSDSVQWFEPSVQVLAYNGLAIGSFSPPSLVFKYLKSDSTPLGRAECLSFGDYWLRFVLQRDGFLPVKFRWSYCLVLRYAFPVGSVEVTA